MRHEYLARLRKCLSTHFDVEEFRTLCQDLGVDYDSLRGEGKIGKIRELVAFLERHHRMPDFMANVKEIRPDVPWNEVFPKEFPPPRPLHAAPGLKLIILLVPLAFVAGVIAVWFSAREERQAGSATLTPAFSPAALIVTDNTPVTADSVEPAPPALTPPPIETPTTFIPIAMHEVSATPAVSNAPVASAVANPTRPGESPPRPVAATNTIPVPTAAATNTIPVPTVTAPDTPVALPPFTSTPEPSDMPVLCSTDLLAGGFGKLYQDDVSVRMHLGCPTKAQVADQTVVQFFENGMMYWWEQTDTIYAIAGISDGEYWVVEREEAAQYPPPTPDPDSAIPLQGGFGRVYAGIPEIGSQLGIPLTGEQWLDPYGVRQRFEYGLMLFIPAHTDPHNPGKLIFVLYDDSTFTRHYDSYEQ